MKKIYIILTAVVVGLFAFTGCTQSAQNQDSEQPSTQSSEQGQASEQSSNQSQISEQTSEQSQNQSQISEQTSEQSQNQSQISEQTSDESISLNSETSSNSKLTLAKVKDIIANSENFEDIYFRISKIQKPDDVSGSGFLSYTFWLNDDHTESIYMVIGMSSIISYRTYDSEGKLLNSETLYEYSAYEYSATETSPADE